MIKFRMYFDKDEETKWLNEMAQEGYAMTGFFAGFYTFEKCEKAEWEYQIDFGRVTKDYREFMEDAGIEIVQTWAAWIILRRKRTDEPFKLYTDVDSSIEHYKKIRNLFKIATIVEIICFFTEGILIANGVDKGFFASMVLLAVIIIVLMRALVNINKIIAGLKERKGEVVVKERQIDMALACGLMLNMTALCMGEYDGTTLMYWIKGGLQIMAIVLMAVGIFRSAKNNMPKDK